MFHLQFFEILYRIFHRLERITVKSKYYLNHDDKCPDKASTQRRNQHSTSPNKHFFIRQMFVLCDVPQYCER
jgi:hypothetical protein